MEVTNEPEVRKSEVLRKKHYVAGIYIDGAALEDHKTVVLLGHSFITLNV